MPFYALRVLCQSCGSTFLVGGDRGHDLTKWRECEVECPHCQARTPAEAGRTVALGGARIEAVEEGPAAAARSQS